MQYKIDVIDQNLKLIGSNGCSFNGLINYDGQSVDNDEDDPIIYDLEINDLVKFETPNGFKEWTRLTTKGKKVVAFGGWGEYLKELEKQKKVSGFEYNAKRFWWIPLIVSFLALIVAIASYFND